MLRGLFSRSNRVRRAAALTVLLAAAPGCERRSDTSPPARQPEIARAALSAALGAPGSRAPAPGAAPPSRPLKRVLIAGGDVSFGRMIGQILLREPERELFASIAPLLASGDVRFCNLESQLSDQRGETESPRNNLVFTGPPAGAGALARAGFNVVSTANNHAWDYGKDALFETMDHLDRAGVRYVGTGRSRDEAYRPLHLDVGGFRIGMLAVTDIWNQGPLWSHPAAAYVAGADLVALPAAVRALRADPSVDAVVVSYHGLAEYMDQPMPRTRELLRAAIDAGADVVIGHHPHVINGIEWRNGRPILYSLGNLLMRMNSYQRWTEMGYLARIGLARGEPPEVSVCPVRIHGIVPLPFVGDPDRAGYERTFFEHLAAISKALGGTLIAPPGEDGCAKVAPVPPNASDQAVPSPPPAGGGAR